MVPLKDLAQVTEDMRCEQVRPSADDTTHKCTWLLHIVQYLHTYIHTHVTVMYARVHMAVVTTKEMPT